MIIKWCCVYELTVVLFSIRVLFYSDLITKLFTFLFDILNDGIKDDQKNDTQIWITLKNSFSELKHISLPVRCDHLTLKLGVEVHNVVNDVLGDIGSGPGILG